VGAEQAAVEGEVTVRVFGQRVAAANSPAAKARLVGTQTDGLQARLDELDAEQAELEQAHENGTLSNGQYRARLAKLYAEQRALQRLANRTERAARDLPEGTLQEQGVNVSAIRTLQSDARNLTGPEVAEVARGVAGRNVGRPAGAGPPDFDNETRGPPGNGASPGEEGPPGRSGDDRPPGQSGESDAPGRSGEEGPPGQSGEGGPPGQSGADDAPGQSGEDDNPGRSGEQRSSGESGPSGNETGQTNRPSENETGRPNQPGGAPTGNETGPSNNPNDGQAGNGTASPGAGDDPSQQPTDTGPSDRGENQRGNGNGSDNEGGERGNGNQGGEQGTGNQDDSERDDETSDDGAGDTAEEADDEA